MTVQEFEIFIKDKKNITLTKDGFERLFYIVYRDCSTKPEAFDKIEELHEQLGIEMRFKSHEGFRVGVNNSSKKK